MNRRALLVSSMFAILTACTQGGREQTRARSEQPPSEADPLERQLFDAVNEARRKEGVPALSWHDGAAKAARSQSVNMAERGFFSHTDPQLGDLAARTKLAGVGWSAVAENLFQEQGFSDPVAQAVQGWLNSPGHRRNMLNPEYTHAGVGISKSLRGVVYCTEIFLVPAEQR